MKIIINLLIFCIVLFLYLHIYFHIKTSDDLEIYEIDKPSKEKLEEICDLRQPVVFDYNSKIIDIFKQNNILDTYGAFDIKIRNTKTPDYDTDIHLPIVFNKALDIIKNDNKETYFVENNMDFLEETTLIKHFSYNDYFLRPPLVSNCNYDYIFGSKNTVTPFRYELNYRNYFLVTEGVATIRLSPFKSSKYLYTNNDYENFEFRSEIDPWNVSPHYKADFDKIKCLDVIVNPGYIIYIPAYWYYSIKFNENTSICVFKYRTYMNNFAILPQLILNILQNQNIKRQVVKHIEVENNNSKNNNSENNNSENNNSENNNSENNNSENNNIEKEK